jgi:hypothetical protein
MTQKISALQSDLRINVELFATKTADPGRFLACCEDFVSQNKPPFRPLSFCMHLRRNQFPVEAKTICQFYMSNTPAVLGRFLG